MQIITAVTALALGVGYLVLARAIPDRVFFDPVGPRIFPTLVALGVIACGVSLAWQASAQAIRQSASAPMPREGSDRSGSEWGRLASVLVFSLIILLYALLLEPIGYVITTVALILLVSSYCNRGRHLQNVAVSVLITSAVYYCFTEFLRIGLPRGLLQSVL